MISVNIITYETFSNWLTHHRNDLFDLLQLYYDNLICYTNINIPNMIKQLNKHKLLSSLLSVLERRSKRKNKMFVKSVKKFFFFNN